MSSRNTFTTNYIYHQEAVRHIHREMESAGYGIKTNKGLNDDFQVVGMIKNAEWNGDLRNTIKELLEETKKKFNIQYELSIVFVGDTYKVITFITTNNDEDWRFEEY